MATDEQETSNPPPPSLPLSTSAPTTLHQYPEMILAAIEVLNEKGGTNKSSISKHIEATCAGLPATHSTLLSHHLDKMKQSGQLILVKNNYMKSDSNPPPRRGRGRPPKPKVSLLPDAVLASPRPRGRPPKPKDPLAPRPPSNTNSGSGRKRGRKPKAARTAPPPPLAVGVRRGRGRPPKVAAEPVGA